MKRVLVIEDNENNLYLIRFILEKNGYEVIEARDGLIGVKLALEEKPYLILMDIQLPVLNGYEAMKKIRSFKETKDIPIIALTSYAMVGDKEKALNMGFTGYIEKPINPETIIVEIEKYL
ncbi:MAG: response regulator [Candidatus Cloacimonetes bacterium]|nr:response regulator [Candidatus Cloacimonadota bacterium]